MLLNSNLLNSNCWIAANRVSETPFNTPEHYADLEAKRARKLKRKLKRKAEAEATV